MINNNFRVMGVAISNFEDVTRQGSQFQRFRMLLEVENSKGTFKMPIEIFGNNQKISPDYNYIGHYVCVEGYLDSRDYVSNGVTYFTNTFNASYIDVLDGKFKKMTMAGNGFHPNGSRTYPNSMQTPPPLNQQGRQQQSNPYQQQQTQQSLGDVVVNDEDLPF